MRLDDGLEVDMVLFGGAFGLIMFAVWVFCIIDVVTAPAATIRNLPKLAWVLIVILLVDLGSIAWLVAGRDWSRRMPAQGTTDRLGGRVRAAPGTARTRPAATNPDDDEEFLAALRERVAEQRRRAQDSDGRDHTGRDDPLAP